MPHATGEFVLNPDATEYDPGFLMKLLTVPEDFFATYEPPQEIVDVCPEPDPYDYAAITGSNRDHLHKYLDDTNQHPDDLSWVERLMLSRGGLPYTRVGRVVLGSFILEATAEPRARRSAERYMQTLEQRQELLAIRGLRVGEIVEEPEEIPDSTSGQKMVTVHVGVKIEGGEEVPDLRKIICGGTDIVRKGHKVVVALPGALTADGRRVKAKRFKIGDERRKSQAVLCSEREAPVFFDRRNKYRDQVLVLPDHPDLQVGVPLDHVQLSSLASPYREQVTQLSPNKFFRQSVFEPFVSGAENAGDPEAAAEILELARKGASKSDIIRYYNQRFASHPEHGLLVTITDIQSVLGRLGHTGV